MDAGGLMARRAAAAALLCLALAGCSSASREEMSRDVLQSDPSFQALLDRRDALERQVDDLRAQLVAASHSTEQQVRALQQQFRDVRARMQEQMRALIRQLEPVQAQLQLDINTARHQIQTQDAVVQGLKKTIGDLQRALKGALPPTGGPMAESASTAPATQLADTQRELERAENELTQRRAHLKILEHKLRLLRID